MQLFIAPSHKSPVGGVTTSSTTSSGTYKWLSMCFGTPYGILSPTNLCRNMITPMYRKKNRVTVFGDIYSPLASSPVTLIMFGREVINLCPPSGSFWDARDLLLTVLVLAIAIFLAKSLLSLIASS